MPPPETAHRTQTAVLWPRAGVDAYGETVRGEGVELAVRWEQGRRDAVSPEGRPVVLDAVAVVDRDVAVGSLLWLGELADWLATGSGGDEAELMEVRTFSSTPDVKGRNTRRVCGLAYYRSTPPESS